MSSGDNLKTLVPLLDGLNWRIWETQMTAYLRSKGLWQIVIGRETRPDDYPPNRAAITARPATDDRPAREAVPAYHVPEADRAARAKEQLDWDTRDDMALGVITLCISHSLKVHIGEDATASQCWNNLKTALSSKGATTIFNDFQRLINMHITSDKHPANDMDNMWELFERLKANEVDIPEVLRVLILLNALPTTLSVVSTITLQTQEKSDLDFNDTRQAIITEYERRSNLSANKLSAVKRKGADPSFSSQKRQASDRSAAPSTDKRKRKPREEKPQRTKRGSGKFKRNQQQDTHEHSHLGSIALLPTIEEFRPQIVLQPSRAGPSTTSVASFSKDAISYRKVDLAKPIAKSGDKAHIFPDVQKS